MLGAGQTEHLLPSPWGQRPLHLLSGTLTEGWKGDNLCFQVFLLLLFVLVTGGPRGA